MEFLPSVSRSGGLQDGGDTLKDAKVQMEYRTFIESKLQRYWSQYPAADHLTGKSGDSQRDLQSNILILFRKLREGLMASKRVDDFALEVYETSLFLSVLFRAPAQTTSIVNQLIPHGRGIYDAHAELFAPHETDVSPGSLTRTSPIFSLRGSTPSQREREPYRPPHTRRTETSSRLHTVSKTRSPLNSETINSDLRSNMLSAALIACFHILVHSYPSQCSYYSSIASFRQSQIFKELDGAKDILKWLQSIASAVASRNYVRFERLSSSNEVDEMCHRLAPRGTTPHLEMRRHSLRCLVEDLRTKVRGTVWEILTVTYRELDTATGGDWLLRSLMIAPDVIPGNQNALSSACQFANRWLEQRGEAEVRKKEGFQGRWILCRRRV